MMERRKLQQVGGGTYTVSIPKAWATEHGLEAGNTVHLFTHSDGSMVVRSAATDGENLEEVTIEVECSGPEPVARTLEAAQAVGFDTVSLVRDRPFTDAERRAVRAMVRSLAGVELVVESEGELRVRTLLDAADVSVRQSVVRLRFVALSIHREATAALLRADADAHERLVERVEEATRLSGMVARYFNRSLVSFSEVDNLDVDRPELFDYYVTATELEAVANHGLVVARVAGSLAGPRQESVAEEVRATAEASRDLVDDATGALLAGDVTDRGHEIHRRCASVRANVEAVERALFDTATSATEACALVRALDSLVRTTESAGAIADQAIRRAVREQGLHPGVETT